MSDNPLRFYFLTRIWAGCTYWDFLGPIHNQVPKVFNIMLTLRYKAWKFIGSFWVQQISQQSALVQGPGVQWDRLGPMDFSAINSLVRVLQQCIISQTIPKCFNNLLATQKNRGRCFFVKLMPSFWYISKTYTVFSKRLSIDMTDVPKGCQINIAIFNIHSTGYLWYYKLAAKQDLLHMTNRDLPAFGSQGSTTHSETDFSL